MRKIFLAALSLLMLAQCATTPAALPAERAAVARMWRGEVPLARR